MPEEPTSPSSKPAADLHGLDPGELLARGLHTVKPSAGSGPWEPPTPEALAKLLPQYRIESLLGRGGMGAVYKGVQESLDRPVAIKLLPAELAGDGDFLARFQREARTLAKLQHSGIVTVYDFGQTSAGHPYFVMEYVDGTDLQHVLKGPGLQPEQAFELIAQICDALYYAHRQGVIHRDIKPANILLTKDGRAKVADFGLARPLTEESGGLTMTNMVMGTPDYMAPETRTSATHADHRADIFALGVMLYEMLTGQRPHGAFQPPSQRVQVDVRIDEVVLKALQQEPARRYQQASEMKQDVERIRTTPPEKAKSAPFPWRSAALVALSLLALIALGFAIPAVLRSFAQRSSVAGSSPAPVAPITATKDAPFVNSLGMKFVPVPGADTLMCIHETRRKDYAAYADAVPGVDATWKNPLVEGKLLVQGDDHPVVMVSWQDATAFCAWLSQKEGRTYRLPTEREWNLSAVFDVEDPGSLSDSDLKKILGAQFAWGTKEDRDGAGFGNYLGKEDGYEGTAPVMSFSPNPRGIYDLGGNVWEWCGRQGVDRGSRLLRGCGYLNHGPYRRSITGHDLDPTYRTPIPPLDAFNRTWIPGFRVVLDPAPSKLAVKSDEPKPAVASPSEAALKARERGGRLRAFGNVKKGPVELGKAAEFTDFQTVNVSKDGWAARRVGGDTYCMAGLGPNPQDKAVELGPYKTTWLEHIYLPIMRMAVDGSYRNVYGGGQSQLRKEWAHPDSVAFLNPYDHFVALDKNGKMLFSENWHGKDKRGRLSPPTDFFLGATAYTATSDHYLSVRPGLPVRSFQVSNGTVTDFPSTMQGIIEMDSSNGEVILLNSSGQVFVTAPNGQPSRRVPPDLGAAIAVRAGDSMFAAQMTDGTWRAWGDADELIEQTRKIGPVIDVDYYSAGNGKPSYMLWIEPVDAASLARYSAEAKKRLVEAREHLKAGAAAEARKITEEALATAVGDLGTMAEAALLLAEAQAPERASLLAGEFVKQAPAEHPQFAAITELRVKLAPTLKQYEQRLRTAAELVGKGDDAGEVRELKAALALVPDGKQAAEKLAATPLHVGRALPGRKFANELGHTFVPVNGLPAVLFSIWETRVKDFEQFVKETGYDMSAPRHDKNKTLTWQKPGFEQTGDHPVVLVSREDAEFFCRWLTDKERAAGRLLPGQVYRLPTDREWSAAMGVLNEPGDFPAFRRFPNDVFTWPKDTHPARNAENLNWKNDDHADTAPVGSGKPNRFGLFDLLGNVQEICADPWDFTYPNSTIRGNSYQTGGTVALRGLLVDSDGNRDFGRPDCGFRCVLDLKTETQRQMQIAFEQGLQKLCDAAEPKDVAARRRTRAVINDEMVLLDLYRSGWSSEKTLEVFAAAPVTHFIASGATLKGAMQVTKKWPLRSVFLHTLVQAEENFLESFRGLPLEWAYLALHQDGPMAVKSLDAFTGMKLKGLYLDNFKNLQNLAPLRGMPLERFVLNGATAPLDLSPLKDAPLRSYFVPRLISLEQFLGTCDWWGATLTQLESDGARFFRRFFLDAALTGQPARVQEVKETLSKKLAGFPVFKGWLNTLNSADTKKSMESAMAVARFVGGDATAFDGQFQAFNGHSYLFWDQELTLDEAKAYAVRLGGHLITITSKEENDFVIQQMEAGVFRKNFSLGLERTAPGRMGWKWVTGEPLAYHNWGPESGSLGNGASFVHDKGQWVWFHGGKEGWGSFIIEWDTPTPQPPAAAR